MVHFLGAGAGGEGGDGIIRLVSRTHATECQPAFKDRMATWQGLMHLGVGARRGRRL